MTTKKMVLGLGLGLCSLLAFSATNSYAEAGFCSRVKVLQAGARAGQKFVQVQTTRNDCVGWALNSTRILFLSDTNLQANAMLAAALSAQATGGMVLVISTVPDNYNNGQSLQSLSSQVAP